MLIDKNNICHISKKRIIYFVSFFLAVFTLVAIWMFTPWTSLGSTASTDISPLVDQDTTKKNLATAYMEKYLITKTLKVIADDVFVEFNLMETSAPIDFDDFKNFIITECSDERLAGEYSDLIADTYSPEINDKYINQIVDELQATLLSKGFDAYYEVDETGVYLIRGKENLRIDTTQAATMISVALSKFSYDDMHLRTWPIEPGEPNWNDILEEVSIPAINARYDKDDNGKPVLINHVPGKSVDIDVMKNELISNDWGKKLFPFIDVLPLINDNNINVDLFPDLLSTYSTKYNEYETSRSTNLKIATQALNDTIILPGEIFSFNETVGQRTRDKGYLPAIIFAGTGIATELGGGICQVSSTIYNTALLANMKQVTRYYHSQTVTYVPLGLDATIYWGSQDYIFQNDKNHPIKIVTNCSDGLLTISIFGTKEQEVSVSFRIDVIEVYAPVLIERINPDIPAGESVVYRKGKSGYKVDTYKKVILDGVAMPEVKITTSIYKPTETIKFIGNAYTGEVDNTELD